MNPQVPTGHSSEVIRDYYNYMYSYWLDKLDQTYFIHWDTLGWVLLWLFVLAAGFYAYARWQKTTHADQEPYPVETYNGYIQETNGPVGAFLTLFFIGMIIWLVTMTILNIQNGQLY
ncbi:MAG: hypothetical protein KatS3mg050_2425 [Litorilinea sp.]|nr:MAG: hypothetical protein KatS3mg050_2425 [Litorilinea sp.]